MPTIYLRIRRAQKINRTQNLRPVRNTFKFRKKERESYTSVTSQLSGSIKGTHSKLEKQIESLKNNFSHFEKQNKILLTHNNELKNKLATVKNAVKDLKYENEMIEYANKDNQAL